MDEKKLKKVLGAVLQWGAMWGNPKHIDPKDWVLLHEVYRELNDGKDFVRDSNKRAT